MACTTNPLSSHCVKVKDVLRLSPSLPSVTHWPSVPQCLFTRLHYLCKPHTVTIYIYIYFEVLPVWSWWSQPERSTTLLEKWHWGVKTSRGQIYSTAVGVSAHEKEMSCLGHHRKYYCSYVFYVFSVHRRFEKREWGEGCIICNLTARCHWLLQAVIVYNDKVYWFISFKVTLLILAGQKRFFLKIVFWPFGHIIALRI